MYSQIYRNKLKTNILIFIFIIVVICVAYAAAVVSGGNVTTIVITAFIFSILSSLGSYYYSDKIALSLSGARGPIKKEDNPYVYRMVENLCITAGLPMPKIYIIPTSAMNAFATGRDPAHSSIALTSGIIENLENEELEGVIAHELSHIKNYDIRVMSIVAVLAGIVVIIADYVFRWGIFFGGRRNSENSNSLALIVGIVMIVFAPVFAELIKLAVSRKREFLADASAAMLTRYPEGLARALEKIAGNSEIKNSNAAIAHLYISSPFGRKAKNWFYKLLSTHPPVEERIAALRSMTQ